MHWIAKDNCVNYSAVTQQNITLYMMLKSALGLQKIENTSIAWVLIAECNVKKSLAKTKKEWLQVYNELKNNDCVAEKRQKYKSTSASFRTNDRKIHLWNIIIPTCSE